MLKIFIEFIGVTSANKIIYRFQVYNSIIHHCMLYFVFTTPLPSPFILPVPSSTYSHPPFLVTNTLLSVSVRVFFFFFWLNPFTFFIQACNTPSLLTAFSLFSVYESLSVLFVSLFSLDSTYE